jgi:hypothetical protein
MFARVLFAMVLMLVLTAPSIAGSVEVRDRNGRLVEIRYSDGTVRDANGRLKESWSKAGDTKVVRDRNGRIIRIEKKR